MKHKNIIELYEYSENSEEIALYVEFANKPFFLNETIMDQHTPIDDEEIMKKYAKDILSGLSFIHGQGIIHGDLKLPNLLCHEEDDDIIVKI
jgi:mitogen-activated protein kinase kinase kinase